ncbi:hypothetical protein PMAYCL1PPCAC_32486, partial [Pristionchus mayeri]
SAESTRSSRMIVLIVLSTLINDLPQAVINVLIGIMADRFRSEVATKLESLIVALVAVASACNLITHLSVSRRFRDVWK